MSDVVFEERFAELLRSYARAGAPELGREALSRGVAAGVARPSGGAWWRRWSINPRLKVLAQAATMAVVVAAVVVSAVWFGGNHVVPPGNTPSTSPAQPSSRPSESPQLTPPADSAPPSVDAPPAGWPGPIHPDASGMPLVTMDGPTLCVAQNGSFDDGIDAENGFVDITTTGRGRDYPIDARTAFALAEKPPLAADLDPVEALIQYGVVFDSDADGSPDYELGIDNSAGDDGYRTWVRNVMTGELTEQVGPPYGSPFEFVHPDGSGRASLLLWFLDGSPFPAEFRDDYRYYAWSSYSENGSVIAWDYAPDFGWLGLAECEPLPVEGWPSTTVNSAGMYSWAAHRSTCAGTSCNIGFMRNGNGSGDLQIRFETLPEPVDPPAGQNPTYHEIAGHYLLYQLTGRSEEWTGEFNGTTVRISLTIAAGTSQPDRDEAHAIIESLTYEPQDDLLGFRLIFTLATDDWESG